LQIVARDLRAACEKDSLREEVTASWTRESFDSDILSE
jgi:hypothetical protein